MDMPIIKDIVVPIAVGFLAPITTYLAVRAFDRSSLLSIKGDRKAIAGDWAGKIKQELKGAPKEGNIEVRFTAKWKTIRGEAALDHPEEGKPRIKLALAGGFPYERYLKFDYKNADESVLQFGCLIAHLTPEGTRLEGRFVGYGSISRRVVYGNIFLDKILK